MRKRLKAKPGRNSPCPCNSGKKFKRCCTQKQMAQLSPPVFSDWMSAFLEENVRPYVNSLRADFQYEYLRIYEAWASDPIHDQEVYATDKCWRMVELAELYLKEIASSYQRRILIKAIRSIPLSVMASICVEMEFEPVVRYIRDATIAAWLYAQPTPEGMSITEGTTNQLHISPDELARMRSHLGIDLARFMGAISARAMATTYYRLAGKGGTLIRPDTVPLSVLRDFKKTYPSAGFVIVPTPTFKTDKALTRSIEIYESRRGSNPALTGLLLPEQNYKDVNTARFPWWEAIVPKDVHHTRTVKVVYKSIGTTVTTSSFLVFQIDVTKKIDMLCNFADEFLSRFGFNFESFTILCAALYKLIRVETAYNRLDTKVSSASELTFTIDSTLAPDEPLAYTAPSHLYSMFSGAFIRATRANFLLYFKGALGQQGIANAGTIANRFIDQFSNHSTIADELVPSLFFPIDNELIMIDFLLMNEFFEFCLRAVTSNSGATGNRRAHLFEEGVRLHLQSALNLSPSHVPFLPNRDLVRDGKNYGDVDFAFIWKNLLIHLDMKSWQLSTEYFRGSYHAIENRQKDLLMYLDKKVEPRGKKLLEVLNNEQGLKLAGVLSFLCVANVEFLHVNQSTLWYGSVPRVLTPDELVNFLADEGIISTLAQHANT